MPIAQHSYNYPRTCKYNVRCYGMTWALKLSLKAHIYAFLNAALTSNSSKDFVRDCLMNAWLTNHVFNSSLFTWSCRTNNANRTQYSLIWFLTKGAIGWQRQLTHWGRDEMDNISQTTFSNVFSSMKMFEFRLTFLWSLFPRVQFTIFQSCFT